MSYHRKNRDKICRLYARTGQCSFGDVCKYSHERGGSFKPPASFEDRLWSHSQAGPSGVERGATTCPFRVMCYNLLADELAIGHAGELYKAVPRWCLAWEHRRAGLLAEIFHWQPDLLCLQEVDHWEDFQQELGEHGYEGRYAMRTGGKEGWL
ncbi:hypothetical protein WJX84_005965 [Apatococcus fuscideae]|uniref:C3H1-type domain-containing protein n=1 Tax=Apatococcus fuscideae TaxID=2026836 RepID=A0AAW1S003_9CHLO